MMRYDDFLSHIVVHYIRKRMKKNESALPPPIFLSKTSTATSLKHPFCGFSRFEYILNKTKFFYFFYFFFILFFIPLSYEPISFSLCNNYYIHRRKNRYGKKKRFGPFPWQQLLCNSKPPHQALFGTIECVLSVPLYVLNKYTFEMYTNTKIKKIRSQYKPK